MCTWSDLVPFLWLCSSCQSASSNSPRFLIGSRAANAFLACCGFILTGRKAPFNHYPSRYACAQKARIVVWAITCFTAIEFSSRDPKVRVSEFSRPLSATAFPITPDLNRASTWNFRLDFSVRFRHSPVSHHPAALILHRSAAQS